MIEIQTQKYETMEKMYKRWYAPSETYEWYYPVRGTFYTDNGELLRDPEEYNCYSEGYTPFGNE